MDGVSLTHGDPRHHIWTFVAAPDERPTSVCPSLDGDLSTGRQPPSLWGMTTSVILAVEGDILIAGTLKTLCGMVLVVGLRAFNNPPWFYKQLPHPTTDGIEMRVCRDQSASNEDVAIEIVDVYIQ